MIIKVQDYIDMHKVGNTRDIPAEITSEAQSFGCRNFTHAMHRGYIISYKDGSLNTEIPVERI